MGSIWTFHDPKNKANSTCPWLQQKHVKVLECPSQSPDLSIIETLLGVLKCAVHARQPKNLQELEALCEDESESEKKCLIHNYHKRLNLSLMLKGALQQY